MLRWSVDSWPLKIAVLCITFWGGSLNINILRMQFLSHIKYLVIDTTLCQLLIYKLEMQKWTSLSPWLQSVHHLWGIFTQRNKLGNRIKSWLRLHDTVTIGLCDPCDPCQHGSRALWVLHPWGHCGGWRTFIFSDESRHLPLPSMDSSVSMTPLHED